MQAKQIAVLNKFTAIQEFLDANAASLPQPRIAPSRAVLDEAVALIQNFSAKQHAKGVGGTRSMTVRVLRDHLRLGHVRPIHQIANLTLPDRPLLRTAFKLPVKNERLVSQLAAATAMAKAAESDEALFIGRGMPATFVADLRNAIATVEAAAAARTRSKLVRTDATAGIKFQITMGRSAVSVMDSQIRAALASNDPVLLGWIAVSKGAGLHGRTPLAATLAQRGEVLPTAAADTAISNTPLPAEASASAVWVVTEDSAATIAVTTDESTPSAGVVTEVEASLPATAEASAPAAEITTPPATRRRRQDQEG